MLPYAKEYTVNGKLYKLIADFTDNLMAINGHKYDLKEYTDFEGNIDDFIKAKGI